MREDGRWEREGRGREEEGKLKGVSEGGRKEGKVDREEQDDEGREEEGKLKRESEEGRIGKRRRRGGGRLNKKQTGG